MCIYIYIYLYIWNINIVVHKYVHLMYIHQKQNMAQTHLMHERSA